MSEFRDAIEWRGAGRVSFIVYGVWEVGGLDPAQIEKTTADLKQLLPRSEVSHDYRDRGSARHAQPEAKTELLGSLERHPRLSGATRMVVRKPPRNPGRSSATL